MRRRCRAEPVVRDQRRSAFAFALDKLCEGLPADSVALVDMEGETVDYAGVLPPFDAKVTAAEWRLVLAIAQRSAQPQFSTAQEMFVRAQTCSYGIFALPENYALVARLPRGAFTVSPRALSDGVASLCQEAALTLPKRAEVARWYASDVRDDKSPCHRPLQLRVNDEWQSLEIIGRLVQAVSKKPREFGYRVRLRAGAEVTLVRESFGHWYCDHGLG